MPAARQQFEVARVGALPGERLGHCAGRAIDRVPSSRAAVRVETAETIEYCSQEVRARR